MACSLQKLLFTSQFACLLLFLSINFSSIWVVVGSPTAAEASAVDDAAPHYSASRSSSVGSDTSDSDIPTTAQVYAELYPSAVSASVVLASDSPNDEPSQFLYKSLSFKPSKTTTKSSNESRLNFVHESPLKNIQNLKMQKEMEEKKRILDEKLDQWFGNKKGKNAKDSEGHKKMRDILTDWYLTNNFSTKTLLQ